MTTKYALGIDIGGTNTAYGLVDQIGNVIYETSVSTTNFPHPEDLVNAIYTNLVSHHSLESIIGISIGAPNGNHFTGNIEYAPNLKWKGIIPLAKLFQDKFKKMKAILINKNWAAA